mmetsp:Transcript_40588/g.95329  ORF Transcript_40588/g.95329 Transcript_40588/m.95329 type:complete len:225 (+) Transcript_40588:743-1417(+)
MPGLARVNVGEGELRRHRARDLAHGGDGAHLHVRRRQRVHRRLRLSPPLLDVGFGGGVCGTCCDRLCRPLALEAFLGGGGRAVEGMLLAQPCAVRLDLELDGLVHHSAHQPVVVHCVVVGLLRHGAKRFPLLLVDGGVVIRDEKLHHLVALAIVEPQRGQRVPQLALIERSVVVLVEFLEEVSKVLRLRLVLVLDEIEGGGDNGEEDEKEGGRERIDVDAPDRR